MISRDASKKCELCGASGAEPVTILFYMYLFVCSVCKLKHRVK